MNNKIKVALIIFLLSVICVLSLSYLTISFEDKDKIEIKVFEDYNYKLKVSSFFKDVTDEVKIESKPNTNKIGEYKTTYSYTNVLGISKKKDVLVDVIDDTPPVISLKGEAKVEVYLNDEYIEPGYEVTDNYNENINVTVNGKVDTTKVGNYFLVYKAEDESQNKTEVVRKIVVSRVSPLELDLKSFDLNNYFSDIILKENDKKDDNYLKNIVLAGDSVIWKFGTYSIFPSERVWGKPCEGPFNFETQKVVYKNAQSDYTLAMLVKEKQPEYLILHMGICDCNNDDGEAFAKAYEKVIDYIKKESPQTKIIVMSLVPQTKEYLSWIPRRNNKIINKYNYYLANVCQKKNVPFLNVAEIMKNSDGLGNKGLYFDDGYHPNVAGMKKILEYINTHKY